MTNPYAPPPADEPVPVPQNRRRPRPGLRALLLWGVLIALFIAFYDLLAPDKAGTRSLPATPSPAASSHPIPLLPFLIPLATLLVLAVVFGLLRRRLPAAYRSFRLEEIPAPKPPPPDLPPSMVPVTLSGSGAGYRVKLTFDDAGLHWHAAKKRTQPPQDLDVGWNELTVFLLRRRAHPLTSIGLWAAIVSAGMMFDPPLRAAAAVVLGTAAVTAALGLLLSGGQLAFVTETHRLTFVSRQLDETTRVLLTAAAKARRPDVVGQAQGGIATLLWFMWARPFAYLGDLFKSEAKMRAGTQANPAATADQQRAGFVQRRLYALWTSGIGGFLPLSVAVAVGLWSGWLNALAVWFLATMIAFVFVARSAALLARLSGMKLVR